MAVAAQLERYDAVIVLGFGGPTRPDEIRPFLDRVLRGRRIPTSRYEEVVGHYLHIGGASPYNELTQRAAVALSNKLHERGIDLPVVVAMRNASPLVEDVFRMLSDQGVRRVLGIVMAPHQSAASWDRYVERVKEVRGQLGTGAPEIEYVPSFFDHPLFAHAHAARIRGALAHLGRQKLEDAALVFTAHSIPEAVARRGPYVQQLRRSAELIAELVGAPSWTLAYQSRSGSPSEAWLTPDVRDVLRRLPEDSAAKEAIVVPIGFLCDHVEVLYDLDIEAAGVARGAGIRMIRAAALNDHPLFIEMLTELVATRVRPSSSEAAPISEIPTT